MEEHLHHGDISTNLCDNLLVYLHNCFELADQIKLSGLQVGKLLGLINLFLAIVFHVPRWKNNLLHFSFNYYFSLHFVVVYKEATQSPDYKLFQKTAKMCRFFANTLIHYIKVLKHNCLHTDLCNFFIYLSIQTNILPLICYAGIQVFSY